MNIAVFFTFMKFSDNVQPRDFFLILVINLFYFYYVGYHKYPDTYWQES